MNIEQEKMIVEALPSLYPLQEFEEKAIQTILDALPPAEQKRGKWIDNGEAFICSECRSGYKEQPTLMGKPMFEFCPMCGAKMEVTE